MNRHANNPFAQAHNDVLLAEPTGEEEREKVVAELKSRGNAAFKARRPEEALLLYSRAIELNATNHALFGNRSAVNEMLGRGEDALKDAESAITNKPDWAKGYFRKGKALRVLKRYRDSKNAFIEALNIEPDSKVLKKAVDAASKLEVKMEAEAKAKAEQDAKDAEESKSKGNGGGAAPVTIVRKSSSAKKPESNVVKSGEKDMSLRGYKKTADGRTTSFFHRDIDDEAKKLIGSIAPKKIDAKASDASSAATAVASSNSASVWNQGGTYEERSASSWAREYITDALLKTTCRGPLDGSICKFTKVTSMEGDASLILRKQEKRYVFDWELEVDFEVLSKDGTVEHTGTFTCADFDSEAQASCEIVAKIKSGVTAEAKTWAKRGTLAEPVNKIWKEFYQEYKTRY